MNINPHILQFIIDKAKQRYEKYGESFRNDCLESTEIFYIKRGLEYESRNWINI